MVKEKLAGSANQPLTRRATTAALCLLSALALSAAAWNEGSKVNYWDEFEIRRTLQLPQDGSIGKAVSEPKSHQFFLERADRVEIFDMGTGDKINEIDGMLNTSGFAIAPEFQKGFVSCSRENCVRILDLKSCEKTGHTNTGRIPRELVYDSTSKLLFVLNSGEKTLTLIQASTAKSLGQVALEGCPRSAISDGKGRLYVALESNKIQVIDTAKSKLEKNWTLPEDSAPQALALDLAGRRLFCASKNKQLLVLDLDNGSVIATLPIGADATACIFDAREKNVFCANSEDGTLSVIHEETPDNLALVQTITTEKGAQSMVFDEQNAELWLIISATAHALILGKHVPVDDGLPFSRKNAAFWPSRTQMFQGHLIAGASDKFGAHLTAEAESLPQS
jgi:hypothetical protein